MTKQEKIQEAYGKYWNELSEDIQKSAISHDGWINSGDLIIKSGTLLDYIDMEHKGISHRPLALKDVDTNNGWIKIESRADLPKDFNEYWVLNNEGKIHMTEFNPHYKKFNGYCLAGDGAVTHYQAISKPKPPLY